MTQLLGCVAFACLFVIVLTLGLDTYEWFVELWGEEDEEEEVD